MKLLRRGKAEFDSSSSVFVHPAEIKSRNFLLDTARKKNKQQKEEILSFSQESKIMEE